MSEKPKKITKKKKVKKEEGVTHPTPDDFVCELEEQAVSVESNGKVYVYSMDARDFSPEDIKVKITDTAVVLDGCHETEEETIEFNEEIDFPPDVLPNTIKVLMNKNGVLRIQAPIQQKEKTVKAIVTEETRTQQTTIKTTIHTYSADIQIEITLLSMADGLKLVNDKKYEDCTKDLDLSDGKLNLNLDMGGHRVEDIKVSVSENEKVFAVQAMAHYDIEHPPKEIHKKYLIPDGIDPCSFRGLLKKNGVLQVDASPKEPEKKKEAPAPAPPAPKVPVKAPTAVNEPVTYCWIKSQIVEDPKEVEELAAKCEDITEQSAKLDGKKFEVEINVGDFKAEELRLKITNDFVLIHSETRTPKRQFHKKILLPSNVKPQSVKNKMTPKFGLLNITAKLTP